MAFISILLTSLLIVIHPTSSAPWPNSPPPPPPNPAQQACKVTKDQKKCEESLKESPTKNATEIIQTALDISYSTNLIAQSMTQSLYEASVGNLSVITITKNCLDYLENSAYRLISTIDAFEDREIKNCRAWTSAALTYQYECWSELQIVNNEDTDLINDTMTFVDTLVGYTSNALSFIMAFDVYGDQTASWKPLKTERDGFWEGGGGGGGEPELEIPLRLLARSDVSVCKPDYDQCTYETVQEAVNAAPNWSRGWRFVIYVMKGFYEETVRVGIEKQHVVIIGDGMGRTIIAGSLNVSQPGVYTYNTPTLAVLGDGFMASHLTIRNKAGPGAHQAVAFRSDSDLSVIEECEFTGNQNTFHARSLRQFYNSCRITGNEDFIFGNSATYFENCTILIRPRQLNPEKGGDNVVTAQGRIDPAQSTGFVFHNCSINGTEEYMKLYKSNPKVHKNFLGRPQKEFSRTLFIGCHFESLITPQGWMPRDGDFALKTLYYGELNNSGKGSDLSGRVNWSSRIPPNHANVYSVRNFLQGDQWKLNVTPSYSELVRY